MPAGDEPPEPRPGSEREQPDGPVDAAIEAALAELSKPGRLREAEQRVARSVPQLQQILAGALEEGGWFDEAHRSQLLAAATKPDPTSGSRRCERCSPRRRGSECWSA